MVCIGLLFFAVAATPSCAAEVVAKPESALVAPSGQFCLAAMDEASSLEAATAGDVAVMNRLYWHFLGCSVNRELAFHWGMNAADSCDADMQDEIEQWLRSFREKEFARVILAVKESWSRRCG